MEEATLSPDTMHRGQPPISTRANVPYKRRLLPNNGVSASSSVSCSLPIMYHSNYPTISFRTTQDAEVLLKTDPGDLALHHRCTAVEQSCEPASLQTLTGSLGLVADLPQTPSTLLTLFQDSPFPWHTVAMISTPFSPSGPSLHLSVESEGSRLPLMTRWLTGTWTVLPGERNCVLSCHPYQAQACKDWSQAHVCLAIA